MAGKIDFADERGPVEDFDALFYAHQLHLFSAQSSADRPASSVQVQDAVRGQLVQFGIDRVNPVQRVRLVGPLTLVPDTGWSLYLQCFMGTLIVVFVSEVVQPTLMQIRGG